MNEKKNSRLMGILVSMIGTIVFYGDGVHYWEFEELVTRFKSFPRCIET